MYFLSKNLRTCSRSFRGSPSGKIKLFKDGVISCEHLSKNMSSFFTHPEQIKQQLKERDAHMLCQFFGSEEYKKRVSQFLETQGKILAKESITGAKSSGSIKYQHVLSCAQPAHKKPKIFVEEETDQEHISARYITKRKKIKRGTIFEEIIKQKGGVEINQESDCASLKTEIKPKRQSHRQRSTIMPIFLKKIKHRQLVEEHDYEEKEAQDLPDYQTARRIKSTYCHDEEPLYAQILHKNKMYRKSPPPKFPTSSRNRLNPSPKDDEGSIIKSKARLRLPKTPYRLSEKVLKDPLKEEGVSSKPASKMDPKRRGPYKVSLRRNSLEPVDRPQTAYENKPSNKPDKSKPDNSGYRLHKSSFKREESPLKLGGNAAVIPLRMASSTAKMATKAPTVQLWPRKNMNLKSYPDFLNSEIITHKKEKHKSAKDADNVKVEVLHYEKQRKKGVKTKKKDFSVQTFYERAQKKRSLKSLRFDNTLEKKMTMMQVLKNKKPKKNELELTSLFKKVKLGSSKQYPPGTIRTDETNAQNLKKAILKPIIVEIPKNRKVRPHHTKDQQSFTYKIVSKGRERREAKLRKKFQMNPPYWQGNFNFTFVAPGEQSTKKAKELEKVSIEADKSEETQRRYLIRLPKTTPEGYRVLLYSVRDPDPTKMNFNDVVKGFCMYNDCVLSEDGLQEGYVVIFDMRDVSIGHLARVSLPALKCFMYYIQDAHPARIKQIHVLNTASWIQHVMRLVVPLVRSELLNLVKFHKGRLPDGLPVELLPMDYGGEAPTVDELDTTTKSLLDKYRDWLIESEQFKADESKRVKKGGWWGFFSKSPQQVELDEKTILKNLQID